jgi:hypothetical protein
MLQEPENATINCADMKRRRTENIEDRNGNLKWRTSLFGSICVGREAESGEIYSAEKVLNLQFG